MITQQTTLANGLKIITAELAEAHSVTANIFVGTGSRYEVFAKNGGVSHFLEHLLFKGSKKYPTAEAIALAVDAVGGYNNAYTSEDLTSYYIKVPAAHGELALDILCDMMKNPLLVADEIDRERGVIVEEMNVYRDDPARFVHTLIPGLIFPGNSLGDDIIGTEEVIERITPDEIRAYQQFHYRPNNMVVSVAGKVDHAAVVAQLEAVFGEIERADTGTFEPLIGGISNELSLVHTKETAQAHFVIAARAYPYGHPDDVAAKLMTAILGRGMSSRLFLNVRERQGLAYTVDADLNNYVDSGIFRAYAGVNLEKVDQAVTSVLAELTKIQEEPVAAAELAKAKQQLRAGLEMSLESNSSVADRLGSRLVLLGKVKTVEETVAEIEAVTLVDVQRVAKDILLLKNLRMAVISPEPQVVANHFNEIIMKGTK